MSKITSLTAEQEAKIPEFINKWVDKASQPTDRKKATKAVQDVYKNMGEEKPIVIFGQSPYATAMLAAIFFTTFKTDEKKLYSQLGSQLDSQLGSQLYSQLDSQLYSQLGSQLDSQLYSQLDSQLDSQLYSQLDSQLYSQLGSQLYSQLGSQLDSQLYSQLDSQLYSQLGSQLYSQLGSQLYSQLGSQLGSQLYSQLYSIRDSFYMSTFWLAWSGWYAYGQFIGVKFDKKLYDLFMAFVENVGFIIPYKGIAFVSEAPKRVSWENERLHYDQGKAVEYADGWGLYNLMGVQFEEELYQKIVSQEITAEEALNIRDSDQRMVAIAMLKPDRLLKQVNAELVHEGIKGTKLYEVKNFMDTGRTEYCIWMRDASTPRKFIEWVEPKIGKKKDADLCQANAFGISKELYLSMPFESEG